MNNYEKKYKEALDKAKRYDEVFNAAKEWYNNPNSSNIGKSYLYAVFPELKENEDERIRLAMIKGLSSCGKKYWGGFEVKAAIAWLEKQCEQKFAEGTFVNVDDVREDFIQEVYRVLDADSTNDRANQIIDAFDSLPTLELEKQCEQKPTDKVEPKFKVKYAGNEYNVFETKDIAGVTYYGIEDEPNHIDYVLSNNCEIVSVQKIANEFASKFHEGDFVVIQETTYLISKIEGLNVTLSLNGREGIFDIDVLRNAHLYTIEDAKAGDVIYSRHNTESFEWIGIFKSLDKENKGVHFYGFWNNVTKTFKICGNEVFVLYDDFSPATKEQRDKLEKAMADAGYTFDFEKKELKKIDNETEIPYGAKDSELQEATYYIPKGFHAEIDEDKVVIKKGEKPTEWSEEDEYCKHQLIVFCENCMVQDSSAKRCTHWLTSLKDRSTWKPSDEQLFDLKVIAKQNEHNMLGKSLMSLYNDLLKLKE